MKMSTYFSYKKCRKKHALLPSTEANSIYITLQMLNDLAQITLIADSLISAAHSCTGTVSNKTMTNFLNQQKEQYILNVLLHITVCSSENCDLFKSF